MKRWRQSAKRLTNAAQCIRYFMKMKWISTLIPKSAQIGSYGDNKSELLRRGRMKNTTWPGLCTAVRAGGNSKSSALFIGLLNHLKARYRRAKTITLIVDNYIIHKSRETQRWLKGNPKFRVIYQPVYSPWVNHVERLWQALHDTITRNHQCRSMWQLLRKVHHFRKTVSPFQEVSMVSRKCSGIRRSYLAYL